METHEYPFDGRLHPASSKKFEEIILFVHFYEGSQLLIKKHIDFVNSIGFDAFSFSLLDKKMLLVNPISRNKKVGIKHLYADQISDLLNLLPGRKIIFSFSNPTASAFEAMAERSCSDVTAIICDSGPSGKFIESAFGLFQHYKQEGILTSLAKTLITPLIWSPYLHNDIHEHLSTFPKQFPVLSIRGWKDQLIPPSHIDSVFEKHPQINWRKLSLPRAGHLNGLRDFREEYTQGVGQFLTEVAHKTDT